MPRAINLLRNDGHYRKEVFTAGLRAAGYQVATSPINGYRSDDVVVIWNRYSFFADEAAKVEAAGGRALICENGYLGKDEQGRQHYAMAIGGHNGSGRWRVGGPERWASLGIPLAPWRQDGRHILVCGQRGIGPPEMKSPRGWEQDVAGRLRAVTRRPIVVRRHPESVEGRSNPPPPLDAQLAGAWAAVVWSSSVAGKSLAAGIPCWAEAPHHVLDGAVERDIRTVDRPRYLPREEAFERMSWAQWKIEEVQSGEAFRWLLAEGW